MKYLLFLSALILAGCTAKPERPAQSSNQEIKVEKLTEVPEVGCVIFRFWDEGEARYFVVCNGSNNVATWGSHYYYDPATKTMRRHTDEVYTSVR